MYPSLEAVPLHDRWLVRWLDLSVSYIMMQIYDIDQFMMMMIIIIIIIIN